MGALRVPIIAKIEKPEAVHDIDGILDVANGIMVARGDLGVEMSLEMVPPIQKRLIRQPRSSPPWRAPASARDANSDARCWPAESRRSGSAGRSTDRKSTRLNSSHLGIS